MTKTEEKKRIEADKRMQAIKEKYINMQTYATNIQWDTDGEEIDLPNEVFLNDYEPEDEDEISNYLSDTYGYLHNGFDIITK